MCPIDDTPADAPGTTTYGGICPTCGATFKNLDEGETCCLNCHEDYGVKSVIETWNSRDRAIEMASRILPGLVVVDAAAVWALLWRTANPENDPLDKAAAALELRALLGLEAE